MSFGFSIGDFIAVSTLALQTWTAIQEAPIRFNAIRAEIASLTTVLANTTRTYSQGGIDKCKEKDLCTIGQGCEDVLKDLNATLAKNGILATVPNHAREKISKAWQRFRFDHAEIENLRMRIISNTTLLNVFLATVASDQAQGAQQDLLAIRTVVEDVQPGLNRHVFSMEQKKIAEWLSPLDFFPVHSGYCKARQQGTGLWLLNSQEYQDWLNGADNVLWCPGIPGAGKTVMASLIVDHLMSTFGSRDDVAVIFIYCNYKQTRDQSLHNLLGSLLRQLVEWQETVPENVLALYNTLTTTHNQLTEGRIMETLWKEFANYSSVFVVVDALDESSETGLELLEKLDNPLPGNVKFLVTSRPHAHIEKCFIGRKTKEISASGDDVTRYVRARIESNRHGLRNLVRARKGLGEDIVNAIVDNVKGMFLLARLHMDSLAGAHTVSLVRKAINNLPVGVHDTYDDAMERISQQNPYHQELAHDILAWISHAKRPLYISELQHALAININQMSTEFDQDDVSQEEEVFVSVCAGLVVIDNESSIIRLTHYTTQEYFDLQRVRESRFPGTEKMISAKCLAYLSYDEHAQGYCYNDRTFEMRLTRYPFYDYAARFWGHHLRGPLEETHQDLAMDFLRDDFKVEASSQVLITLGYDYHGNFNEALTRFTGAHLAAYFGLKHILNQLAEESADLEARTNFKQTPLCWAAWYGHADVVKWFFERGVAIETLDKIGETPLSFAVQSGSLETVVALLEEGADPNLTDWDNTSMLTTAARRGSQEVIKQLLKFGANANPNNDKTGSNPLATAVSKGLDVAVKALLDNGANPDTMSHDKTSMLNRSAGIGNIKITRLLLAKVVDPDLDAAMTEAAKNGHEDVVQLLLQKGANPYPNIATGTGCALGVASEHGHESVVKLLLRKRPKQELKEAEVALLIIAAAMGGHDSILKLLLQHYGCSADIADSKARTPLLFAVMNGHGATVKFLLSLGSQVEFRDSSHRTPLSFAAQSGYASMIELLCANGASPDSLDHALRTPISYAAEGGHSATVELLLSKGAAPTSKDKAGHSPLFHAADNGHESVVILLLDKGAEFGQDELQKFGLRAAERGLGNLLRILVDAGCKLDSILAKDNNLLSRAVATESELVVEILLKAGAEVNATNDGYRNRPPLPTAIKDGAYNIVSLLLDSCPTGSLNTKDSDGKSPLFYAVHERRHQIVALLLANGFDADEKNAKGQSLLWHIAGSNRRSHEATTISNVRSILSHIVGPNRDSLTIANMLLAEGVDPNAADADGVSPLAHAAQEDDPVMAELLLEHGADVEFKDKNGMTPLFYATANDSIAVAKLLLEHGADLESKDNSGQTALFPIARSFHEAVTSGMLKAGAEVEVRDVNGRTPLSHVAQHSREHVLAILIAHGADVNTRDDSGRTPLSYAGGYRGATIAQLLLKNGADPNPELESGAKGPREYWNESMIEAMANAEAELKSKEATPLLYAVKRKNKSIAKELLQDVRVDPNAQDSDGWTALTHAAQSGSMAIVEMLLADARVQPEAKTKRGETPLAFAAEYGHVLIVRQLLKTEGVDPDARDMYEWTALMKAVYYGHVFVVELLLADKRVDPDAKGTNLRTSLNLAAGLGHVKIAKLLLATGRVDLQSIDSWDMTPVMRAAQEEARLKTLRTVVDQDKAKEVKLIREQLEAEILRMKAANNSLV